MEVGLTGGDKTVFMEALHAIHKASCPQNYITIRNIAVCLHLTSQILSVKRK